jgi:hypothetical protein
MADDITPGATINGWQVLNLDNRRVSCVCSSCSEVRILAAAALVDGSAAPCDCQPLSPREAALRRTEADRRKRQHELKRWRPGA